MPIDIVTFEHRSHDILLGYRQNNAVVFASVSKSLSDVDAKQKGYEQVRKALAYEQMLDKLSIDGSNYESLEEFMPSASTVSKIDIVGDKVVQFHDTEATLTRPYQVIAYDQYGEIVSSQTVEHTFKNTEYNESINTTIGEFTATLNIEVKAYCKPEPSEVEMLAEYVVDIDFRTAKLELGF